MYKLKATVKVPQSEVSTAVEQLHHLGVERIEVCDVPYEQFVRESRMNWDCVYEEMWTEKKDVAYLNFEFDDSDEGRAAAYHVEYYLKQIPLNLRYTTVYPYDPTSDSAYNDRMFHLLAHDH